MSKNPQVSIGEMSITLGIDRPALIATMSYLKIMGLVEMYLEGKHGDEVIHRVLLSEGLPAGGDDLDWDVVVEAVHHA